MVDAALRERWWWLPRWSRTLAAALADGDVDVLRLVVAGRHHDGRIREEAWQNAVLLAHRTGVEREEAIARLDVRTAVLARLISRPGGLVGPVVELIRSGENTPVPDVIARLDGANQARQLG